MGLWMDVRARSLGWMGALCVAVPTTLGSLPGPRAAKAPGDDAAEIARRSWNQDRGNGAGDGFVDVEPVLANPMQVWRVSPGEIAAGPVVWDGTIFCVLKKGRQFTLLGIDGKTGKSLGRATLGKISDPRLVVEGEIVAVCTEEFVRTYRVRGKTMRKSDTVKFGSTGEPCVFGNMLFVTDEEDELHMIDIQDGKDAGSVGRCQGRPSVREKIMAIFEVRERGGYEGEYLEFRTLKRKSAEDRFSVGQHKWGSMVRKSGSRRGSGPPLAIAFGENPATESWYVRPDRPMASGLSGNKKAQAQVFWTKSDRSLSPIALGPIAWKDSIFGYDDKQNFIGQDLDASFRTVLAADKRPKGAHVGPVTRARGVAYAGNLGIDLESGKVLWCLADLDTDGPLIPLSDGRILVLDAKGELVCLKGSSASVAVDRGAPSVTASSRVQRPLDIDGVVLADGSFHPGRVEPSDGGGAVLHAGGTKTEYAPTDLALTVHEGKALLLGSEYPVVLAFQASLSAFEEDFLTARFDQYLRAHLGDECRRLLAEFERLGFPSEQREALAAKLDGLTKGAEAGSDEKAAKIQRTEQKGRAQIAALYHESSDWCGANNLPSAATLLEAALLTFAPETQLDPDHIAAWIPPGFPFRSRADAGDLWLRWARATVPADATFLSEEDARKAGGWAFDPDHPTLALSTPNLLFLTRCTDPEAVGACLRSGEQAVRLLTELFPPWAPQPPPLQVRLCADPSSFRAEVAAHGDARPEWPTGTFLRSASLSVLVLPETDDPAAARAGLRATFLHELTHQYFALRPGLRSNRTDRAGLWAAEGIARFVEEQASDADRADRDDASIPSIDASSQLLAQGKLLPLARLLPLNGRSFDRLRTRDSTPIELRATHESRIYNERAIFHDESAALVYFLLRRAGRQPHQGMLDYLRAVCTGEVQRTSWQLLGFPSVPILEEAFHAFLEEVAG